MKIEHGTEEARGEYMKRQLYMMSNLGLFYVILIALFGIPLLGTFVVVLIKGVLDFRYLILASGILLGGLILFFTAKLGLRLYRRMRADAGSAFRDAADRADRGQPVQLEFFNGLMSLSCGGRHPRSVLPGPDGPAGLLPDMTGEAPPRSAFDRLQALVEMRKEGAIDADEFTALKKKLIQEICAEPDGPPDSAADAIVHPLEEAGELPRRSVSRN